VETLLIDNYDSFSRILFQYLWEVNGVEPIFIHNDEWTLERIRQETFDNILISPGPGRPDQGKDFGVCSAVIEAFPDKPILGVCLGHQGIGMVAGARVIAAPAVRHGKASRILHDGTGLFAGLPQGFMAVRYHSLVIEPASVPENLIITATAEDDGQIMGVQIQNRPCYGVQFHPESFGSEGGKSLLSNFRDITARLGNTTGHRPVPVPSVKPLPSFSPVPRYLEIRELPWQDPETVYTGLFKDKPAAFWLDSLVPPVPGERMFTYMGSGPKLLEVKQNAINFWESASNGSSYAVKQTQLGNPLEFIKRYMHDTESPLLPETSAYKGQFQGGLVGYFGYEFNQNPPMPVAPLALPDALFLEPDRILAFDHGAQKVFAFLPTQAGEPLLEAKTWLESVASIWNSFPAISLRVSRSGSESTDRQVLKLPWRLSADKQEYLASIQRLQTAILAGETYEACLTNETMLVDDADPFLVYQLLRRTNPAPYAAYLHFPQGNILSASPERFLRLDGQGKLTCRPIKGTRRRGTTFEEDGQLKADLSVNAKDQSENLMIVDLVRHDFAKVCALGSVQVPESRVVETHPTVFQLVSSVSGQLEKGQTACDALQACFPGGSMTGAPKRRTMELLQAQEKRARGVFSGGLGYLGWDGAMDLGMTIRTLVHSHGVFAIGCGGAILAESDPEAEFSEAMLKAFASQRAVELAVLGESGGWRVENLDRPI
jgi:para-aminobenzoate synthetase